MIVYVKVDIMEHLVNYVCIIIIYNFYDFISFRLFINNTVYCTRRVVYLNNILALNEGIYRKKLKIHMPLINFKL